jgi:MoxR-like ATPase
VFTSVLVVDELNRMPPRTQSALLECMQERRVTVDRTTHELPDPFFVVATQNPLLFQGTYPLPENQLDRFLLRITLGYPDHETEALVLQKGEAHRSIADLGSVATADELRAARAEVDAIRCEKDLVDYVVALATATRTARDVRLPVSTRGAQALHRAARARALVHGRDYVVPDDIRALAVPALAHRVAMRGGDGAAEALLMELLSTVATPD